MRYYPYLGPWAASRQGEAFYRFEGLISARNKQHIQGGDGPLDGKGRAKAPLLATIAFGSEAKIGSIRLTLRKDRAI